MKLIEKEELRELLMNYYYGGSITTEDISNYVGREVGEEVALWARDYAEIPCDLEGANKEQEEDMTASEDEIINKLLRIQ